MRIRERISQTALILPLMIFAATTALADTAPDCTLKLGDGTSDLRQFRGKVVYVDFWASWCASCLLSFPFLNGLDHDYRNRGLRVVGMDMDEKPEDGQKFLAKHPANFRIALTPNAQCAKDFGVKAMPSSFLVDRNGVIRETHEGFRPDDAQKIRALVDQLLDEKPAAP